MGGLEVLFCGFETDFNFIIILMKRLLVVPVFRRHIVSLVPKWMRRTVTMEKLQLYSLSP